MQQRARRVAAHRREGRERRRRRVAARRADLDRRQQARCRARRRRWPHRVGRRGAARVAGRRRPRAARGRRLGPLPLTWFDKHGERVADLLAARGDDHAVPMYALPDLARLCEELDQPPPPELDRLRRCSTASTGIPTPPLPSGFVGELRPYQQTRRRLARVLPRRRPRRRARRRHGPRQDAPGARASLQRPRRSSCAPTSVLFNWLAEIAQFRPDLDGRDLPRPAPRARHRAPTSTLTSYPILRIDIDALAGGRRGTRSSSTRRRRSRTPTARSRAPRTRSRAQLARDALRHARREPARRAVEPAPLHEPRPARRPRRLRRSAAPSRSPLGDAGAAARLRERIRPFVLRRMKREVAPRAAAAHRRGPARRARRGRARGLRRGPRRHPARDRRSCSRRAAASWPRSRRCCACARPRATRRWSRRHARRRAPQSSSKLERLLEALDDAVADGHKALVFSQWTSLLDLIEPHLDAAGIAFARLDGSHARSRRRSSTRSRPTTARR